MLEFPRTCSFLTKGKFHSALAVENYYSIVNPIHQIDLTVGTDGKVAGLICLSGDLWERLTVEALYRIRFAGKEGKEEK